MNRLLTNKCPQHTANHCPSLQGAMASDSVNFGTSVHNKRPRSPLSFLTVKNECSPTIYLSFEI